MATARYVTTFVPIGRIRQLVYSLRGGVILTSKDRSRSYLVRERIIPPNVRVDSLDIGIVRERHYDEILKSTSRNLTKITFASDVPLR